MVITNEKKLKFMINCAYLALITLLLYLAAKYLLRWVMPFIIGYIIAAAVQPAARYFNKKNNANIKAVSVAGVLLLVAAIIVLAVFVISRLFTCLYNASAQLPAFMDRIMQSLKLIAVKLTPLFNLVSKYSGVEVDTSFSGISNQLLKISQIPENIQEFLQGAVSSLPRFMINFIVTVVAACFIAADYSHITGFIMRFMPKKYRESAVNMKNFFFTTVLRLIRAYALLMLITFTELFFGLLLLRISHPLLIAVLIAFVDLLPVLGTGTVLVPWAIIEFLLGNAPLGIGLALLYAVITVVRNILEPKIVGKHVGLNPLITLFAIVVGFKAMGIMGMFIALAAAIVIKHLYESGTIKLWKT
jgi:sporulation integral membrane protein YtvI